MKIKFLFAICVLLIVSCRQPFSNNEKRFGDLFQKLNDYNLGLGVAKANNMPLLIHFTGYACVNSRKMEDGLLLDQEISELIRDRFIAYNAYVDDHAELEKSDVYFSKILNKEVTTYGEKFMELEMDRFHFNTQPYFVIVAEDGVSFSSISYTNDKVKFMAFLNKGLKK